MKFNADFPKRIKIGSIRPTNTLYPEHLIGGNRKMHLFDESLLSILMQVLDFQPEILEPPDKEYGNIKGDGNYTGLIGMVQKGEVDFAFARLAITYERTAAVDFSYPYSIMPVTFITDKPRHISNSTAVFQPFSSFVWIAILISLVVVILVLYLSKSKRDHSSHIMLTYGVLLEKSINMNFLKRSMKLLISVWVIGAMFITMFYEAVLLSFLTVPVLSGVRDISELSAASENPFFKCSVYKGSKEYQQLNAAEYQSWNTIAECLNRSNMFTNDVESFLRPSHYRKAFIAIRTLLAPFQKNHFLSEDIFYINMLSIPVRKTFCCKDTLDELFHKITAAGLFHKFLLDEEYFISLAVKDLEKVESDVNRKLSLVDLSGAFMILLIGLFLACIIFVLEVLVGRKSLSNG